MQSKLILPVAALFLMTAAPAVAHHSYTDPYCPKQGTYATYPSGNLQTYGGSSIEFSPDALIIGGIIVLVIAAFLTAVTSSSRTEEAEPSGGLLPTETPEHYDQEAARKRAYARLLEADAVLLESQTRLALKQDEHNEVGSFLRDKNSGRRG